MPKTLIIGSGISGLGRAWMLKQRGIDCTVIETSHRSGGSIQSHRVGPYLAEEGPHSVQVSSAEVDSFLKSIPGLAELETAANPSSSKRFIVRNGHPLAVPTGPLSAITTPLWSLSGKLRVLREPFIRPISGDIEESAADFVRRRLGDELYRYAINPLIGGIYAGNPEALSLRYAFPKLYALEQTHGGMIRGAIAKMRAARKAGPPIFKKRILSYQDGLASLTRQLTTALGPCVHTSVAIKKITRDADGWAVTWNGQIRNYSRLVLTTPAHTLSRLPFDSTLRSKMEVFNEIDYPPVSVLTLAFKRSDVAHPLDGFGMLVPECEQRSILGVLFPSSLFEGRCPEGEVLLSVFVGGERQPHLAQPDTEALTANVLPELEHLLGATGAPTFRHHKHWPRAIPQYKLGYGALLAAMETIEDKYPGLDLAGNYRHGISLNYCMEAALRP